MGMVERFAQYEGEYGGFEKVENKRSSRRDIHAFILLNELQPDDGEIIGSAEHDEYYLNIEAGKEFCAIITDEQIRELVRCGVMYSSEYDGFMLFA